jgi:hypothetical protein
MPLSFGLLAMANDDHLARLKNNVAAWNVWRRENPTIHPDLSEANLSEADLSKANLIKANLRGTTLFKATLFKADLFAANLSEANLSEADLGRADLLKANLFRANLFRANLNGAKLVGVNLESATLVETDLTGADLTGCRIYGVSAWRPKLDGATKQQNLIVTPEDEPAITVDNIGVAQFIYLLLHDEKLREVIDTITSKVVLILGFTPPGRKGVLDALREELRRRNYLPVLFESEKPRNSSTLEIVMLLARMARFVIADLSDAKSVFQELQEIVPSSPKLPVQPIIVAAQEEPGMLDFFKAYPWFLEIHRYDDPAQLLADLNERVIDPAEVKVAQLRA